MNQEDIYSKVQSILDRANHPNTPREEAETALAMAQKLILKYSLDESAFAESSGDPLSIVKEMIVIKGKYNLDRLCVASTIARANSCACFRSSHYGEGGKKVLVLYIFGTEADIFSTKTMWASADAMIARLLPKQGDRRLKGSWIRGFRSGVESVLHKAKAEIIEEQGAGAGLVLADKAKRADSEMRSGIKLKTMYRRTNDSSSGWNAGRSAGASFNGTGIGGRQRALNA